jgi:hexosaminidase
MKKHFTKEVLLFFIILFILFQFTSCKTLSPTKEKISEMTTTLSVENIIPIPVLVDLTGGIFNLKRDSKILFPSSNPETEFIAKYLQEQINSITGYELGILPFDEKQTKGNISLIINKDVKELSKESYSLIISENLIELKANQPEGLFRGVQTIIQMLFPLKNNLNFTSNHIEFPTVEIKDNPRFEWRGVMLDVARHFFGVNDVKKLIDLIALYKFNRLHLHLTDDQGWRIEIKSWPKLTEIGGSTQVGGGSGGYYTQKDYSEIVRYAKERYITIVPEIDMPGHTNAALASYPELNCDGVAPELYTGIKVGFSSLCLDKEITYDFIKDVIREVSDLTPGPYIHIGGDEAYATDSLKYIKFIERVQQIVESNNKKMIGWEEITQSKLSSNSVVQYWRKTNYVSEGLKQGNRVIFSPSSKVYMDMKYNPETELGLNWAGYIEVSDSYNWDPLTQINGISDKQILGVEAPLWTETILNFSNIEFMLFPRLPGIAEIGWSPSTKRNWNEYKRRLANHGNYWEKIGMNFYKSPEINWNKF